MTPPTAPERCPTCDRESCPRRDIDANQNAAAIDCLANSVTDWRARAIAAEPAAAQWAKVAPLIERLREATSGAWDREVVADIAVAILAATEATP